jgi:hypothetical protein
MFRPPSPNDCWGMVLPSHDERVLVLPLRQLPACDTAVASLIANQASHTVVAALADHMTAQARSFDAEMIIGLPTLGLAFGRRKLGMLT